MYPGTTVAIEARIITLQPFHPLIEDYLHKYLSRFLRIIGEHKTDTGK